MTSTLIYGTMKSGKTTFLYNLIKDKDYKLFLPNCMQEKVKMISKDYNVSLPIWKSRNENIFFNVSIVPENFLNLNNFKFFENQTSENFIFDEVQFFNKKEIEAIIEYCKKAKINTIFAGLELDFKGQEFESVDLLKKICSSIINKKAKCDYCEIEFAILDFKKKDSENGDIFATYQSLCLKCFCIL